MHDLTHFLVVVVRSRQTREPFEEQLAAGLALELLVADAADEDHDRLAFDALAQALPPPSSTALTLLQTERHVGMLRCPGEALDILRGRRAPGGNLPPTGERPGSLVRFVRQGQADGDVTVPAGASDRHAGTMLLRTSLVANPIRTPVVHPTHPFLEVPRPTLRTDSSLA